MYAYNVVASAAREGARYGILNPTNSSGIRANAKANMEGLNGSRITVSSACSPNCDPGSDLSVTVSYQFQPITLFFSSVTLVGKSTMTIE